MADHRIDALKTLLRKSTRGLQSRQPLQQPRRSLATPSRGMARVAVLYQAIEPPIVHGVRKPPKPGGYRDSGADIAYVLREAGTQVITPKKQPSPTSQDGWCFPDNEEGILSAIEQGATHLWANTILFDSHPLQKSKALDNVADRLHVIGQPPKLVELYDDKNFVNSLLRKTGDFSMPRSWIVESITDESLEALPFPVVAKPIRGRGSHGVKLCHNHSDLQHHLRSLLDESPQVMIEEFLSGQEVTVTVMPPSREIQRYWPLPAVARFNHNDGIAPYNGIVAVTQNSRTVTEREVESDNAYTRVCEQCVQAAELLRVTAPIRIDVRRYTEGSNFALFDVNMKPNMTGPGRPGREDQASLTALAATQLGWSYSDLLHRILHSAQTLQYLRAVEGPSAS